MVKIQRTKKKQYLIYLPKRIVEMLGYQKGDTLTLGLDENKQITLKKEEGEVKTGVQENE